MEPSSAWVTPTTVVPVEGLVVRSMITGLPVESRIGSARCSVSILPFKGENTPWTIGDPAKLGCSVNHSLPKDNFIYDVEVGHHKKNSA